MGEGGSMMIIAFEHVILHIDYRGKASQWKSVALEDHLVTAP